MIRTPVRSTVTLKGQRMFKTRRQIRAIKRVGKAEVAEIKKQHRVAMTDMDARSKAAMKDMRATAKAHRAEARKTALAKSRPPTRMGRIGASTNECLAVVEAVAGIVAAIATAKAAYQSIRPTPTSPSDPTT